MGGKGSGGRRIGAGRKRTSALERAITGIGARGVLLQHPSSTAVAPIEAFEPPAWLAQPPALAVLTAALERLTVACAERHEIAEAQARVDALTAMALEAVAIWHELAPAAFEARTLTPATAAAFAMLCRGVVTERDLAASLHAGGPNHRGLMQRVGSWMKDFCLLPLGKSMYAAEPVATTNPLDRFTKKRGA